MDVTGAWDTDLANIVRSREQNPVGATVGHVVGLSPLSISILGGEIIIQSDVHEIYINKEFDDYVEKEYRLDRVKNTTTIQGTLQDVDSEGDVEVKNELEEGDVVLVLPDNRQQTFFILNKIERVGG